MTDDISGLPVLDGEDRVLDVISESDLISREAAPPAGEAPDGRATFPSGTALTAGGVMSAPAVTVHAEETAADACA